MPVLILIAQEGLVVGGTDAPHPVVTSVNGSTATVHQDCSWNTQYAADKKGPAAALS
ncbi:MAG: hypothetical protein ABR977_08315 [Candidatus Dormibacteria bacterium]